MVHDLQYHSMVQALGLPHTVSRNMIETQMGERSVLEKTKIMSNKIINSLKLQEPVSDLNITARKLRNRIVTPLSYKNKDLITRLFVLSNVTTRETKPVKFELDATRKFIKRTRKQLKEKIKEQTIIRSRKSTR